jgi:hypothetical protein
VEFEEGVRGKRREIHTMRCWENIVCGGQKETVALGGFSRISDDMPSAISSINRSSISGNGRE